MKNLKLIALFLSALSFTLNALAADSCFSVDGDFYIYSWSKKKPDGIVRIEAGCKQMIWTNLNPGFEKTEIFPMNQEICESDSAESTNCTTYIPGEKDFTLVMTRQSARNTSAGPMIFSSYSTLKISKNYEYPRALSGLYQSKTQVSYADHPEYNDSTEIIRDIIYQQKRSR